MIERKNDPLSQSNEEFKDLRLRLRALPIHSAPPALLHSLKQQFVGPTWKERFLSLFTGPAMWRPISAVAVAALVAGAWITHWKMSENDLLDVQPLVAAHARYQSESMVPSGDLAGSGFGFQLASYYGEEN